MGAWSFSLVPHDLSLSGEALYLLATLYFVFMLLAELKLLHGDGHLSQPQRWNDRQLWFLVTPLVILAHEIGHGFALSLFSRAPVRIEYRFFYGFTESAGFAALSARQRFWVALAGTLFAMLCYHAVAGALYYASRAASPMHYDAENERFKRAAYVVYLQQGLYALVYYPLISIPLSWGDFTIIYSISRTPWLSCAWGVVHLFFGWPLLRAHAMLYGPDAELSRPLDDDDGDLDDPGPPMNSSSVVGSGRVPATFAQMP